MPSFTSVDTNVNVQQPSLSTSRPKVNVITPMLAGIEKLAEALSPREASAMDLLNAQSVAYDKELTNLEEGGKLDNNSIARLNRKHQLEFQTAAMKSEVDIKDYNAANIGLEKMFEDDTRYTVNKIGDVTTKTDRNGNITTTVNGLKEKQDAIRGDVYANMTPSQQTYFGTLKNPTDQNAYIKERIDINQEIVDRGIEFEKRVQQDKINEITDKMTIKNTTKEFRGIKGTLGKSIMIEVNSILESGQSPLEMKNAIDNIASQDWLVENAPELITLTDKTGRGVEELVTFAETFSLDEKMIEALSTDFDNLDMETKGLVAGWKSWEAKAKEGLSPGLKYQAMLGSLMPEYGMTTMMTEALLAEGTPERVYFEMITSSDATVRNILGPKVSAFGDITSEPKNIKDREVYIETVNNSIYDLVNLKQTIKDGRVPELSIEDVISSMKALEYMTTDFETNEDYTILRDNFMGLISSVRLVDGKDSMAHRTYKKHEEEFLERFKRKGVKIPSGKGVDK